jgi:hypothetical protein
MSRESVEAKGRRYLVEGRLQVVEVGPGLVRALCRGDGALHRLGWWRGRWGCSCPAGTFGRQCAHLVALRLVTIESTSAVADARRPPAARTAQGA